MLKQIRNQESLEHGRLYIAGCLQGLSMMLKQAPKKQWLQLSQVLSVCLVCCLDHLTGPILCMFYHPITLVPCLQILSLR